MSEIRDKVRKEIDDILNTAITVDNSCNVISKTSQILSIPELAIVDREAKLPSVLLSPSIVHYKEALKKGRWVKEVKV